MKKIKKQACAYFFLCIVLLLTSCTTKGSVVIPETTSPILEEGSNETAENLGNNSHQLYEKILSDRVDRDFGGRNFRIATDNKDLILSDNGESLLGKEHYLRNAAIEKKYNVKIVLTEESGTSSIADRIKAEALAGNDYCDLILLESFHFQNLAQADALINVRSVPYLDVNASFYNENSLKATTLGNTSYGFAGDFIFNPDDVNVVFFNKTLLSQSSLPDLYSLVKNNQWDMDNFLLYSEEVFSLAQSNGANVYGILSTKSAEELVKVFWAAAGMDFMKNEYGMRPELIYNNESTEAFIEQFRNIFIRSVSYTAASTHESAIASFSNGGSLFLIASLATAPQLVGSGIDWGIVPIPKLDINQKNYYSYIDSSYRLAGFSKGTSDLNFSGILTSAFFACSEDLNLRYSLQTYLNLYFSSPEDATIMKEVIDHPYYDPVEFFSQFDSSFTAATQTVLYRAASGNSTLGALYNQSIKMLNKYLDTIF